MGEYQIRIKGAGPHSNGQDEDADKIAAAFVEHLQAAGHSIVGAQIQFDQAEPVILHGEPIIDAPVEPAEQRRDAAGRFAGPEGATDEGAPVEDAEPQRRDAAGRFAGPEGAAVDGAPEATPQPDGHTGICRKE